MTIKFGIIGTGEFAQVCHIEGLQSHPDAYVSAVCSRSAQPLDRVAKKYGIPSTYQDYKELIESADVDAISIVTPDASHYEIALHALKNGKHVLCEKPLAKTVEQAKQMTEIAQQSGLVNMVAFTFRYSLALQKMRSLINEGFIGDLITANMQIYWGDFREPKELTWREDKDLSAAGIWGDASSHLFDAIRFCLGEISSLTSTMGVVRRQESFKQATSVDYASCIGLIARESKNCSLEIDPCTTSAYRDLDQKKNMIPFNMFVSRIGKSIERIHEFEITGQKGSLGISLTRGDNEFMNHLSPGAINWRQIALPDEAYTLQPTALKRMMQSFVEAVKRGELNDNIDASFIDGLKAQQALDHGIKAAQNSDWQVLKAPQLVKV